MAEIDFLAIDFLAIVEQGAESWNRWRADHPDVQPDLSKAYLFGQVLDGFDLSNANLARACLIGASLRDANLNGACLLATYASNAHLNGADLGGANLNQANFSEADFSDANLSDTQAIGTNFTSACFTGARCSSWQISPATALTHLRGSHIYLVAHQHQCRPHKGQFQSGQLAELLRQLSSSQLSSQTSSQMSSQAGSQTAAIAPSSTSPSKQPWLRNPAISGLIAVGVVAAIGLAINGFSFLRSSNAVAFNKPASLASDLESNPEPSRDADSIPLPCQETEPTTTLNSAIAHEYTKGMVYYGDFADGQPTDGRGTMVYPSGNRYDGEYKSGQRHGCGTFTFSNGRHYVGQFDADQFSGKGIWILANGERYIGEFDANQCSGEGTFILSDGSSKSGTWEAGKLLDGDLSCDQGSLALPTSPESLSDS
ncbi:MAG: pentapeptide repeat-containing protein [Phormidesmis sp.]